MITPSLIAAIMAGHGASAGFSCPVYTTVTLQLTASAYTPPVGSAVTLQLLPCPYTPPPV